MNRLVFAALAATTLFGCAVSAEHGDEGESDAVEYEAPFVSDVATLVDFEFDGEIAGAAATNLTGQIRAQMMFAVGHFNAEPGVARLERLKLTNITRSTAGVLKYHAKLPVAWGSKVNLPSTYSLTLPKRVDAAGQQAFLDKYSSTCDDGEHAANVSNYWYHYRPRAAGCSIAATDAMTVTARATVSKDNTIAKYPEYHKVWEDSALTVLSVFGKYEEGATTSADAGIAAYEEFQRGVRAAFPSAVQTGSGNDVTFKADLGDGRRLEITALLIDGVRVAPASFDARYAELTPGADVILYNGHAGLGANIRALQGKGKYFPGKYQIFFLNGCDTFAYLDDALATARAGLNTDDATGTKYMDIVTNAMPAYFNDMADASMALIGALANPVAPKSYGSIFREVSKAQVVVATGEEDNVFTPARRINSAGVFHAEGAVLDEQSVSYQSDVLPAGKYVFAMTPDGASPGGDADLFVRVGAAPTATATYKCKSYIYNSNERCAVTLTAPSRVYMIAKGDKAVSSKYRVDAFQQ